MVEILRQSQTVDQDKLIKQAELVDENRLKKYEPLIADMRKDSRLALMNTFIITIRRLTLLYMAMFITEWTWLTVLVFMIQNLLSLVYLLHVMPYVTKSQNNLNILNESVSLLVSYLVASINDIRYIGY